MRVLLINPPYQTLTSNLGVGHQVPLGLLMVGGALLDAGFEVELIDAESRHLSGRRIASIVRSRVPDVVMTGHAGSTPAHPVCMRLVRRIKQEYPRAITVYGGVFPTYHAQAILAQEPAVDIIVRGEGEATACELVRGLSDRGADALTDVEGIAFRRGREIVVNKPRPPIEDLDQYRVGWELIREWDRYRCFGLGRAAIVQFSRGCPHRCTYCGQHGFWVRWRHRAPASVAAEIARLREQHDVRFVTLADENPTTSPAAWRQLLEDLAARRLGVHLFATIRASDIVRDRDFLDLYRRAGLLYVLLGVDTTDPAIVERIRKRSTPQDDARACALLRRHGIRSIVAQIVGLGEETWAGFRRMRRALDAFDGDLLNAMYATPHSWTRFAEESSGRPVVQEDQGLWDYRHQVLAEPGLRPWQLFAAVKWLELSYHARPARLRRLLFHRDPFMRRQLRWTALHTGAVWLGEVAAFLCRTRFSRSPRTLRDHLRRSGVRADEGAPLVPLRVQRPGRAHATPAAPAG